LTVFTVNLFYIVFLSMTLPVLAIYAIRGSSNLVLPCIGRWWYKLYTVVFFAFMFSVFVIAAVGTRRAPCGRFTAETARWDSDQGLCPNSTYISTTGEDGWPVGLIQQRSENGSVSLKAFDGWCQYTSWKSVSDLNGNITVGSA
jgi:hypothetical protein